ncbi:MAG: 5-formyltetrahydrofolate cyclo-ligase [Planctomycetes bacterium]|nr:5-formyltetrahydrofolate cyclo-ligase [Planctomycetota bacterium]
MDIVAQKKLVRQRVQTLLEAITPSEVAQGSPEVCRRVLASDLWNRPGAVMLFWPMSNEVDVGGLAAIAASQGRPVCLPRTDWPTRGMVATEVRSWGSDLVHTRPWLLEPAPTARVVEESRIGVVIVPGIAFDAAGFRLGRGAGFYDRYLSLPGLRAARIGVAFDCQIVETVPRERHDARLDAVVTPTRTLTPGV